MNSIDDLRFAVIGLGYVGLPLAAALGTDRKTIGFDLSATRIEELRGCVDRTHELTTEELTAAKELELTTDAADLKNCNFFIVTVPTPIKEGGHPDLSHLEAASKTVGEVLSKDDIVVFESTVYPSVTEEFCASILEEVSGLELNVDFFLGYSPERINPGDQEHRLRDIIKVTSGSTPETAALVDSVYKSIITAGTHLAPSISVAEASKVIENAQRDLNIAFFNELSLIFDRIGIRTRDVIDAAATKWNFLKFEPGLVGGHCIGVDPYYLAHKAEAVGHHPEIILAGRRINSRMASRAASRLIKGMIRKDIGIRGSRVLMLGLAFKEGCPDVRNTKVVDMLKSLQEYGADVDVHDPWVPDDVAKEEFGIELVNAPEERSYDAVVLAVPHQCLIADGGKTVEAFRREGGVLMDLKSVLPREYDAICL